MVVRDLITRWGFKIDDKPLKDLENGIKDVKASLAAVGAAGIAAAGSLFGIAKMTANVGDEAAKAARSIGITSESLQELAFAASIGGVEQNQLVTGMQKLSRSASEAADGVATYKDAYDELGINVKKTDGSIKSSEEILTEVADAFQKLPDGTRKTALAMDLMGRSGAQMINVLNGGSEGLQKLRQEAQDSGFVLSETETVLAEEFNDSLNRMFSVLKGVRNQLGVALLKPIKGIIDQIRLWVLANRDIIKTKLDKFIKVLVTVTQVAFQIFKRIFEAINALVRVFGGWERAVRIVTLAMVGLVGAQMLLGIGQMISGLMGIVKAFRTMGAAALVANAKALLIPILIGAAVVALGLLIEDVISFFQGKNSITGVVVEKFQAMFQSLKEKFLNFVGFVKTSFVSKFNEVFTALQDRFSKFGGFVKAAISIALTPVRLLIAGLRTVGNVVSAVKGGKGISGVFGAIKGGLAAAFAPQISAGQGNDPTLNESLGLGGIGKSATVSNQSSSNQNIVNNLKVEVPPQLSAEQAAAATQLGVKDAMASVLRETSRQVSTPVAE